MKLMFKNKTILRLQSVVNLEEDSILGDLIQEIVSTPGSVRGNGAKQKPLSVNQEMSSK